MAPPGFDEGWPGGSGREESLHSAPRGGPQGYGGVGKGGFKKKKKGSSCGFETLGLSLNVFRGVKRKGYQVPTPIQRKTLPLVLAGHDVVAMARTGSGKTAAFLIPMLERLRAHSPKGGGPRAIILSPTRELAMQTDKFSRELGRYTDLTAACLVGGDSMEDQFEALARGPDVIIATPGRLMHHLSEVEDLSLRGVEYVVFDEADRLFEMGFATQLREILRRVPEERQTLLFSATMPALLAEFARAGLREPHLVRLDTDTKISPDLALEFLTARPNEKLACLLHLLKEHIPPDQQTIIFAATKHHVELLHEVLQAEGLESSLVYGTMDQTARKIHMGKFRARRTKLLVVTDVAARGLDVPLLDNVVNFDFPAKPKLFVHRAGRAARAGRTGTAYSLLTHEELPYLLDLHLFLSRPVRAAPSEDAVESSGGAALAEAEAQRARGETVFGAFPQPILDLQMERVRGLEASNYTVATLAKVADKALRLYMRTRPAPSSESIKRAKTYPKEGTHLLLRAALATTDAAAAAFAEHLKAFRPKQTVLEAEAEAAKGKRKVEALEVMRQKRSAHSGLILQHQAERHGRAVLEEQGRARGERREQEQARREGRGGEGLLSVDGEEEDGGGSDADMGWGGGEGEGEGAREGEGMSAEGEGEERGTDGEVGGEVEAGIGGGKKRKAGGSSAADKAWKRTRAKPQTFRDAEFFIQDIAPNRHMEQAMSVHGAGAGQAGARESFHSSARQLEQEVLDLVPEDGDGVKQKRATYHWDKKSKKYVKLHAGESIAPSGKIRTESGARVNVNSRGIYKKWKERTHKKVGGSRDTDDAFQGASQDNEWKGRGAKGSKQGGAGGGRGPRDELKGPDEIRKQRQTAAFKQQMTRGRGGGRGGSSRGGGGRGGGGRGGGGRGGSVRGESSRGGSSRRGSGRGGSSRGGSSRGGSSRGGSGRGGGGGGRGGRGEGGGGKGFKSSGRGGARGGAARGRGAGGKGRR